MTKKEWLTSNDVLRMLDQANCTANKRKLRLFACACCRRFLHLLPTKATRRALEASEGAADGLTKFAELAAAKRAIPVLSPRNATEWASNCAHFTANRVSKHAALDAYSTSTEVARSLGLPSNSCAPYYAALLREILGNPFRPVALDPAWLAPTVVALTQSIYDARSLPSGHLDVSRLAMLADALEEAGCTHPDILAHLRSPGPHVRGCWPLDLLLGKE